MQAKKIALCAIICLANQAFAHTPSIEDIANTPCGQHDCHCPEELKLAHEQEQLKQLGIDPTLVKALRFVAKKDKQEIEQDIRDIRKKICVDFTCFLAGFLLTAANIIANNYDNENNKTSTFKQFIDGSYILGLNASVFGAFFGIRDYLELSNKKKQLEKINS